MNSRLDDLMMKAEILVKLAPLFEGHHPPCDNDAQALARKIVKELAEPAFVPSCSIPKPEHTGDTETFPRPVYAGSNRPPQGLGMVLVTQAEYDSLKKDKERLDQMEAERLDVKERDGYWWCDGPRGPGRLTRHPSPRVAIDAAVRELLKQAKKP